MLFPSSGAKKIKLKNPKTELKVEEAWVAATTTTTRASRAMQNEKVSSNNKTRSEVYKMKHTKSQDPKIF